jgi:hypothetical protein
MKFINFFLLLRVIFVLLDPDGNLVSLLLRGTDLDFLDSFIRLESDVGDAGVHHEAEQIENEVGMAAQVEEGGVALPPELLVAGLAIKNPPKKTQKKHLKNH